MKILTFLLVTLSINTFALSSDEVGLALGQTINVFNYSTCVANTSINNSSCVGSYMDQTEQEKSDKEKPNV